MSKENKKLTIREQVKLYTVNFLLRILEKLFMPPTRQTPAAASPPRLAGRALRGSRRPPQRA